MPEALLIGLIALAVLACPAMMWLGRRGVGPGCGTAAREDESLESLRRRRRELDRQIAELEPPAANVRPARRLGRG